MQHYAAWNDRQSHNFIKKSSTAQTEETDVPASLLYDCIQGYIIQASEILMMIVRTLGGVESREGA